ncbi:hypothetical protein GCM10023191_102400 [Actinoallomurus oryzae]|uniref:Uncharacterized protein n=1 Tax=Actinoallomurus oryzae TaxID=502180 RepID=A0ABP8R9K7_9ACTN
MTENTKNLMVNGDEPPIVLGVDEGQALLADPAVTATVADLIRLGRQAGIGAVEGDRR